MCIQHQISTNQVLNMDKQFHCQWPQVPMQDYYDFQAEIVKESL